MNLNLQDHPVINQHKRVLVLLFTLTLTLFMPLAFSEDALDNLQFESEKDAERFRELTHELRCLVCQNQSLADSDAELAQDLRDEVYSMVKDGKSNQDIIDFLVNRYGDFVLYRPPVKQTTYLLWFGPVIIILAIILYIVMYKMKTREKQVAALSTEEQQKLNELLKNEKGDNS